MTKYNIIVRLALQKDTSQPSNFIPDDVYLRSEYFIIPAGVSVSYK